MPKVGKPRGVRVVVTGGRDYSDYGYVERVMNLYRLQGNRIQVLIYGVATGADTLCYEWAVSKGILTLPFPVTKDDWSRLGRGAGPIRNRRMIVEGKPDICIAFPGGRGTANMVSQCKEFGVPVILAEEILK